MKQPFSTPCSSTHLPNVGKHSETKQTKYYFAFTQFLNNKILNKNYFKVLFLKVDGLEAALSGLNSKDQSLILKELGDVFSKYISGLDDVFRCQKEHFAIILNNPSLGSSSILKANIEIAILQNAILKSFNIFSTIAKTGFKKNDNLDLVLERLDNKLSLAIKSQSQGIMFNNYKISNQ